MPTCFVIQPFDGGTFEKRYDDVYAPAIRAAGLEPYRVDQDPNVSIPIDEIESGIREAAVCLAEITLDNPNVWFELGYAIACRKEVVLLCSDERTGKFPFDVQHRTIVKYDTGSKSDFETATKRITEKLKAYLAKSERLAPLSDSSRVASFDGMMQHEIAAVASLVANSGPDGNASLYELTRDMESIGFTREATTIAIRMLRQKGLVDTGEFEDENYQGAPYTGYFFSGPGWDWVVANQDQFVLRKTPKVEGPPGDEVPF